MAAKTKTLTPRASGPADKALGEKIRTRRVAAGMSQDTLGHALGVAFQQIRIRRASTASARCDFSNKIAGALDESVSYFQNDGAVVSKAGREMQSLMTDPLNQRICRALSAIRNQAMRHRFGATARKCQRHQWRVARQTRPIYF